MLLRDVPESLLPNERELEILARLRQQGRVSASALAVEFGTSEHTIRRHLRALAAAGHCKRVYGGALLNSPASAPAAERAREASDRKARLARTAVSLVRSNSVVLLDAGTTNTAIAAALPSDINLTVITNSPDAASSLTLRGGFNTILIGGRMSAQSGGSMGSTALLQVQRIRADLCFLGACSIDPLEGVGAFDAEEAELKRAMVESSGQVALAMLTEKLMTATPYHVTSSASIDCLILESDVGNMIFSAYQSHCGRVLVARA